MPLLGILIAFFSLMIASILEGGSPMAYINVPAWLIVFGGTCGAGIASYSMAEFMRAMKQMPRAFKKRPSQLAALRDTFIDWQRQIARSDRGTLEIEAAVSEHPNEFLRRAMTMVINNRQENEIRAVLENEMDAVRARHQSVIQLYFTLGGYGPTFGIIGTVMGLVTVLGHLDDPSELGHAIAVAFIACLVGVASANVLWFPVSSSLKHQHEAEMAEMDLIVTGTLNLQGRRGGERTITGAALKELLDSTVEPKAKITFKRADGGGDGGGGGDGDGGGAT